MTKTTMALAERFNPGDRLISPWDKGYTYLGPDKKHPRTLIRVRDDDGATYSIYGVDFVKEER